MSRTDEEGAWTRHILWRRVLDDRSHEFFEISHHGNAATMAGWIIAEHEQLPALITYRIVTSGDFAHARSLEVESCLGGQVRHLRIEAAKQGAWMIDGAPQPAFEGCTDVDLEWSPATNLFPIRRLMLANAQYGDSTDVRALWVRMPHLAVEPAPQRYTRLADDRFRYESLTSDFTAELQVDDLGLPESYAGIWRAVTRWRAGACSSH